MADWTNWIDLDWIDNNSILYQWPGVYQIRLTNKQGHPFHIPRFLSIDIDGLLVTGESVNVAARLKEFLKASEGKSYAHSTAERLYLIRYICKLDNSSYKGYKFQYRCKRMKDKTEAEAHEEELLKGYFKQYGELPPLNSEMPDKYIS